MGAKTLLTVEHLERLPETVDVSYELTKENWSRCLLQPIYTTASATEWFSG